MLKKCIKEKPLRRLKPCSIKRTEPRILGSLTNDRVSFRKSRINVAVNFQKYVEWNKETGLVILEMSSEIIPNSIISFISASFTQIAAKLRPELVGENSNPYTGSRNRVVSRLSTRFPVLKWRSHPLTKSLNLQKRKSSTRKLSGQFEFEGFHTQLDCKLTYGIKNQTQLTLVWYI